MFPSSIMKNAVRTVDGRILEGWARSRTQEGLLYYLNHNHGITQWDHPEYIRIMNELLPINTVKYAAYRMACKLRHLQRHFRIHEVPLHCVASAFDCAGLRAPENGDVVPVKEIERVLLYIYRTTFKHKPVDPSLLSDLMMNMILNTYDENRSGNLQVFKCKVLLVVMCGGRLQEKYRYLFNQIADHNNCCTRRRLARMLQNLAAITELLSEQLSFGICLVPAAVDSCFKEIEGDIGITEDAFLSWLLQEPQTLVWWTTLYRLSSAELVCHDIKCGSCKQRPIIGLRYQCLKCLGYNLCQDCFLHGRSSRSHKSSHPLQEYCHESSIKEWRRSIVKILKYRLRRSSEFKQRYLTISTDSVKSVRSLLQETESLNGDSNTQKWHGNLDASDESSYVEEELASRTICESVDALNHLDEISSEGNVSSSASQSTSGPIIAPMTPRKQIYSVIKHLEDGQRMLHSRLENGTNTVPLPAKLVEAHAAELQIQISKLKAILHNYSKYLGSQKNQSVTSKTLPRMESTPIVGDRGLQLNLSPIGIDNQIPDAAVLDNKENHYFEKQFCSGKVSSHLQTSSSIASSEERQECYKSLNSDTPRNTFSQKENRSSYRIKGKLPSFTEISMSDLTISSRSSHSTLREATDAELSRQEANTSTRLSIRKPVPTEDEDVLGVKEELEKILEYLEELFPHVALEDNIPGPHGPIIATCEIGDSINNYVQRVPQPARRSNSQ